MCNELQKFNYMYIHNWYSHNFSYIFVDAIKYTSYAVGWYLTETYYSLSCVIL